MKIILLMDVGDLLMKISTINIENEKTTSITKLNF
jgi:hypothetical protein